MQIYKILTAIILALIVPTPSATIPDGYYDNPVGKSGAALRSAISALSEGHTGSMIFDLGGRCVSGRNLSKGIYIVTVPGAGGVKIMVP